MIRTLFKILILWLAFAWVVVSNPRSPWARAFRARLRGAPVFFEPISGTAILVSLAFSAASMGASYAVARLTAPKPTPIDRGKQHDVRVMGSEYGTTIPRVWGRARLSGNIVWSSGVREIVTTSQVRPGGKKGPKQTVNNYSYATSLALMVCEGPVASVPRIWADDEVISNLEGSDNFANYYEAEYATLAGAAAVVDDAECSGGRGVSTSGLSNTITFSNVRAERTGSHSIFIYYKSNSTLNVSLAVNGGAPVAVSLPGTGGAAVSHEHAGVTLNAGGSNTVALTYTAGGTGPTVDRLFVSHLLDLEEPQLFPEPTGFINPGSFGIANEDRPLPRYNYRPNPDGTGTTAGRIVTGGNANVRIYTGTATQAQDSLLVAALGATRAPAHRRKVVIVLEDFFIKEGRVPNFTVEVEQGTHALDLTLQDLYGLVGVSPARCEFSGLSTEYMRGLIMEQRSQVRQLVEFLQLRHQFDVAEVDAKIRATKRGGSPTVTINWWEMRAHDHGAQMPAFDCSVTDTEELRLPRRVDVNYLDPAREYHTNTQSASRFTGNTFDVVTINLPLVLTEDEAAQLAEIILFNEHTEKRRFEFVVGPKYLRVAVNDVINLNLKDAFETVRVVNRQASFNGQVKLSCVATDASVFAQSAVGTTGTSGFESPKGVLNPAVTLLAAIDTTPLNPNEDGWLLYLAGCGRRGGEWRGSFINRERVSDLWEPIAVLDTPATMGVALTALPTWSKGSDLMDTTNTVDVGLYYGTADSVDESDLYTLQANRWQVGGETLQAMTATELTVAAGEPYVAKYRLSRLLRGRNGTEWAMSSHAINEPAVFVDGAVEVISMSPQDAGGNLNLRAVTVGMLLDDAATQVVPYRANSVRPLSVIHATGARSTRGDILIRFTPRTRRNGEIREGLPVPSAEETKRFWVEVLNAAKTSVLRSMPVILGMRLPVVLNPYGTLPAGTIDGNRIKGPAAASGYEAFYSAYSEQDITETGVLLEGSLNAGINSQGSRFGVRSPVPRRDGTLPACDYEVVFVSDTNQFFVKVNGATVFTDTGTNYQAQKVGILFSGTEVRFYLNYSGPTSAPFYVSPVAPQFPYKVDARAYSYDTSFGTVWGVSDLKLSTSQPATVYSAAQIRQDFNLSISDPLPASINFRIFQESTDVGRGFETEVSL